MKVYIHMDGHMDSQQDNIFVSVSGSLFEIWVIPLKDDVQLQYS